MNSNQFRIVLVSVALVVLAWIAAIFLLGQTEPVFSVFTGTGQFDPGRALHGAQEFVKKHPRRVLGSSESRQSTGYIQRELSALGYKVNYTHFEAILKNRKQIGRNVLGFRAGSRPEIIAIVAHYDTATTTFQGAMDNGAGVAVLLELAHLIAAVPMRHSVLVIASDGEEWGMLGTRDLAESFPERAKIRAVLSLDCVASGELGELRLETVGQMRGYSPSWLRELSRASARAAGNVPVTDASGFSEFLERAIELSWTDQGPFLSAGIAAIDLNGISKDRVKQEEIYHSPNDTTENLSQSSIGSYGRAAETIVRSLDSALPLSDSVDRGVRLYGNVYLAEPTVVALQYLFFMPPLTLLVILILNHWVFLTPRYLLREGVEMISVSLPILTAYLCIPLFSGFGRLPRYSLYPATPRDPVLASPDLTVLGVLLAVVVGGGIALFFLRKPILKRFPAADFELSRLLLLGALLVVSLLALQYNSYWAVAFLGLPAWIWGLLGRGRNGMARVAKCALIIFAGIVFFTITVLFAGRLHLGWRIVWYEVLAISNGMFQARAVLLSIFAIAIGIRFLTLQSSGRGSN